MKTVIQVIGTSFCGSSLLNLLLDSQSGIRGLGEASNSYCSTNMSLECQKCRVHSWDCPLFAQSNIENFYKDCFAFYDCDVLVDSSKHTQLLYPARQPEYKYLAVFLSKKPHAWASSIIAHHPEYEVSDTFQCYIRMYRPAMEDCYKEPPTQATEFICKTVALPYQKLALQTEDTIRMLCAHVGVLFSREHFCQWGKTDSHILGGNPSAIAVYKNDPLFFSRGGKYQGKQRKIFYDDVWKKDTYVLRDCLKQYQKYQKELDTLLPYLGHPSVEILMAEVEQQLHMNSLIA